MSFPDEGLFRIPNLEKIIRFDDFELKFDKDKKAARKFVAISKTPAFWGWKLKKKWQGQSEKRKRASEVTDLIPFPFKCILACVLNARGDQWVKPYCIFKFQLQPFGKLFLRYSTIQV
jgi:hypothetical protein